MSDEPAEVEVIDPEEGQNLPAVRASEAIMARGELSVDEVVGQKDKILQIMQRVMTEGVHYGKIPGISKPTLLKPGAEAINVALRLAPDYDSEKIFDAEHLTVFSKCTLKHIPTGLVVASGEGMCSSHEQKYAYRTAKRKCPDCQAEAIIKGKAQYGGGWVCWKKEGGCGHNFPDDDARITTQTEGRVDNPDLPDTWNTVLKMADKRALVAAVLNGTAASDVFTQDVEDQPAAAEGVSTPTQPQPQGRRAEGVRAYPVPHSWDEIQAAVRDCDNPDEAWPLFQAFLRATVYHLFGVEPVDHQLDQSALTAEQRMLLVQKAAGAAVWLHGDGNVSDDGPFKFFLEDHIRLAFKNVLDGKPDLKIPDYVPPEPPVTEAQQAELDRLAAESFGDAEQPTAES